MMKKLTIAALIIVSCVLKVRSQSDPLYTQFMTNPFLINPGIAGTYPNYQIISNNRLQWIGMPDAPVNNVISMFGPTVSQPMGLGGFIMHESWGLTSITSLNGTYAYNYAIAEDMKISMGLAVGIKQYKIAGSGDIETYDPVYNGEEFSKVVPDATLGIYLWSSIYHAGISMTHLLGNKLPIGEKADTITDLSRLTRNVYLHGGYNYYLNREIAIEPTLILRKSPATPFQLDFNVRVWYGKRQWDGHKIWGGISFRTQDAATIMIGFLYQKKIEIGYSYDLGVNKLRGAHSGSHELMIGFKFNDIKEY